MKKIIAVLLVLCFVISFAGCAKSPEELLTDGLAALAKENYSAAIKNLSKLVELEPENTEALDNLALAYYSNGDTERFISTYDSLKAVGGAPSDELRTAWLDETDYEIVWVDANIEGYVREYLDKPEGVIMRSELDGIGAIVIVADLYAFLPAGTTVEQADVISSDFSQQKIAAGEYKTDSPLVGTPLGGTIRYCNDFTNFCNLEMLRCNYNSISDITPLANHTRLTTLNLCATNISDIMPLANLTGLTNLDLSCNKISDITPLANLTGLIWLYLRDNSIRDITPLANLTGLTELCLGSNNISDTTPLTNLTGLTSLLLYKNNIIDITPLSNLTGLTSLNVFDNSIRDITPLANLTGLRFLNLSFIYDISDEDVSWLGEQLPNCDILIL